MRLIILASGSSGNAALIESGGRALLLDAGISARETWRRLGACGVADVRIEAILLTHEHSDHVRGARVLARRLGVPVMATTGTLTAAASCLSDVPETIAIGRKDSFSVAGIKVRSFPTAHDAAETCGFTFESRRGHRIGVATDTGVVTGEVLAAMEGAHVIGLESNHDLGMLESGPYPPFLKRRIAGERGHLSNEAAAAALDALSWKGLSHVFALHLSEQNNTPEAARAALVAPLRARRGVTLETVGKNEIAACSL
jgi:phosphoribosyl 1,2-cyclic phosphodiesterase